MKTDSERISWLEGTIEGITATLDSIERRLLTLTTEVSGLRNEMWDSDSALRREMWAADSALRNEMRAHHAEVSNIKRTIIMAALGLGLTMVGVIITFPPQ